MGGYVCLFLGYCVLQMPDFVRKRLKKMKVYYLKLKERRAERNISATSLTDAQETEIDEITENKIENEEKNLVDVFKWSKTNFDKIDITSKTLEKAVLEIQQSLLELQESSNQSFNEIQKTIRDLSRKLYKEKNH